MTEVPIEILYRDESIIAVNKPEGLLVHRSNIDKYESRFLLQLLRDQIGQYLYPIHRLDKPTSGVILFAFSSEVAAAIQKLMEENQASKEYLLVCRGYCPEEGEIDYPLRPVDEFKRNKKTQKPAQQALTHYRRLNTIEVPYCVDKYPTSRYSLVLAKLLSGRKHQLRRHFKHISHPIIGCPKYGKSTHNRFFAQKFDSHRLLLHSYRMSFQHPLSGQLVSIVSDPSGDFSNLLAQFDWALPVHPHD